MADLHVESKSLDSKFVVTVSRILNSAGVPDLLWGNYLLTIYGVPTIIDISILLNSDISVAEPVAGRGFCCAR